MGEGLDFDVFPELLKDFYEFEVESFMYATSKMILCDDFFKFRVAIIALGINDYPQNRHNYEGDYIYTFGSSDQSISILETREGEKVTRLIFRNDIISNDNKES